MSSLFSKSVNLLSVGVLTVASLVILTSTAQAQIAQWTFETNTPADLTNSTTISGIAANTGTGTASGVHASAATDWTTPAGNGSANSLNSNTWGIGDYYQFQTASTGFENIIVTFDQTRSGTGPASFDFQYSTDGTNFTTFTGYTVLENSTANGGTWNGTTASTNYNFSYDLSAIDTLEDDASIFFRLTSTVTTATAGTNRVDNFTVTGSAIVTVPEPGTFALVLPALGVLGVALARRRKTA